MKAISRVTFIDDQNEKFFGEGPARLLRAVEKEGSLLQSAKSMKMAYSKASRLIRHAESVLGFPLLESKAGGLSGGGSTLTGKGLEWLLRYEAYRKDCQEAAKALYQKHFPEFTSGCVIMASGLGTRFGGNKLMADCLGRPLIQFTLEATEHLFLSRCAVTRNQDTADFLTQAGMETILHDFPGRNDTVRLGLSKVMEADISGCLFCQADQPLLTKSTVQHLLSMAAAEPSFIWRPSSLGEPGSPVWFPKDLFPKLLSLPEGKGGGALIRKYPERVRCFEVTEPGELMDVDTPEDLIYVKEKLSSR